MGRRIRSIKPEILEDEKTSNLTDHEWRLFVSLWLLADDYGNFRADTRWLTSQVFWATDNQDSREPLETLARLSVIRLYAVNGQSYGSIINWTKHQKIDHPSSPSVPGPDKEDHEQKQPVTESSRDTTDVLARTSRESRWSLAPDQDQDQDQDQDPTIVPRESARAPVLAVFEHYRIHHPAARVIGKKTETLLRARLSEGFTVDELKKAIDGNHRDPHCCGQNDRGKEYHDLELIVRDDSHVRKYIASADAAPIRQLSKRDQATQRNVEAFLAGGTNAGLGQSSVRDQSRADVRLLPKHAG